MRRAALIVAAVALAAAPGADAKRHERPPKRGHVHTARADAERHKRPRLRGHVHRARAKAPRAWSVVVPWAVAAPLPAATPAPATTPGTTATPGPAITPAPTPGSSLPPANPHAVSVGSTEFAFTLSQTTVSAGDVRVQFDNSRAEDPHELAIDGPDPDSWRFGEQAAGTVTQRTIVLRPGRHVLFCPLPGHEAAGMRAVLTVR